MNGQECLEWLESRRSIRRFTDAPVPRDVLERVLQGAISAPSNTNRQPWRYAVVESRDKRATIVDAVRTRCEEMKAIIRRGHHAEDFGNYGDFFFEPLESAAVIIIPQYRTYPDLIANFIASGGGDPSRYHTASSMQAELCSTSASAMALLLQAHGEGLGACWMAGPTVARPEIQRLLDIEAPWQMVGAMALGWPAEKPQKPARKPLDRAVVWY